MPFISVIIFVLLILLIITLFIGILSLFISNKMFGQYMMRIRILLQALIIISLIIAILY